MPFTLSHPAIILPFLKNKKASATALIVGSMSPDFVYFFRMKTQNDISHTFLGIVLVDFPLGFIMVFIFHEIIKKQLIENLPGFFQKRLSDLKNSSWTTYFKSNVLKVLISFYLGAVSHLFLDSFVHGDGYFVTRISFLKKEFFGVHIYEIAQYLSSLIGLILIAYYFYKQPPKTTIIYKASFKYWYLSIGFSALFISARFLLGLPLDIFEHIIVSILFSIILAITVVSLFYRNKQSN